MFDGAEKKQAVSIMYFRPGIRWIPTYRVSLNDQKDKKPATVSLQAELLNESEDLTDVPVDIVVGVPNFRFRGTPSPLVLEATLRKSVYIRPTIGCQHRSSRISVLTDTKPALE